MKRLLATTAIIAGAMFFHAPAYADVIYTLDTTNDFGVSGVGPYAQVDIHFVDSTHATATFSRFGVFSFGEMGLDINASSFDITNLSFTKRVGDSKDPDYTVTMGGKVGGIGNFALDYTVNPNGFSDAVTMASFTITDKSGTWADETKVLTTSVPEAAAHVFNPNAPPEKNSFFASGGPTTCDDCTPTPTGVVPEPASIAILGLGVLGIGAVTARKRR
jgi:PEP-CTERM motif